ncbi:MAG: KH domain-containing protein [Thermoleophilia bacterium]|nr:KH domain-containing protein [Thermoleophilia bacterium]
MSERNGQISDYVQFVVEHLVDNTENVSVNPQVEGDDLYVDIEVDKSDRGRVIGKNGRLIRSLRVVVRAAAGRDGTTAHVELVEDDEEEDVPAGSAPEGAEA